MATSHFYDTTKEDSRQWRTYQDTASSAANVAAVATSTALETAARASNPVTAISPNTTTGTVTAAAGTTHTKQIVISGRISTTGDYPHTVQATFASSTTGKATVDATGLVTGVSAGTATVTATAVHNTSLTTTVTITVT